MKKKFDLHEIIKEAVKEAILEAMAELYGVATVDDVNVPEPEEDESGKGGASEETSGGGTSSDGRPKPDVGVGAFSLR